MSASLIGPLPTGHAARILKLTSRAQMDKLIDSGLIPVVETTKGGQRRLDPTAVLDLAARPYANLPTADGRPDIAVHLGPLQIDTNGLANQRTHLGWHQNASAQGLDRQQIEDAWAGLWSCNPERYAGGLLVADISGFVVDVAAITGHRVINRMVRFTLAPAAPDRAANYLGHRITARPGAPFQALG
ncbi:hypothetical protein ACWCPS_38860 [Streptomyces mauvecolor]